MKKGCNEYQAMIASYVDEEYEELNKPEIFLHLAECGSCREFWEFLNEMKLQAAREERLVAPATLDRTIKADARQKRRSARLPRMWQNLVQARLHVPAPVAVLLGLALLAGGAGVALRWSTMNPPAKEVFEPVVYTRLPMIEIEATVAQPE